MRDFRFSLIRKHAIASGDQNHWYEKDEKLMKAIIKRIEFEGPLMAKDFENTDKKAEIGRVNLPKEPWKTSLCKAI